MTDQQRQLSHVDPDGRPTMVDVGGKSVSRRQATARGHVRFPPSVGEQLAAQGYMAKKGSLIDTAIIAATMAVKRTADLIPFCHPMPLDAIKVRIGPAEDHSLTIECTVSVEARTGVEMEALTGVSVAALTIYDMCKALSSEIVLGPYYLHEKTGGKQDYLRDVAKQGQ